MFIKTTEMPSHYDNLEKMSVSEVLSNINQEDKSVPLAVAAALPQIESLVTAVVSIMQEGGRLFYIGAGTSGRLGVVDASECPPTFGVPHDMVIGLICGGDAAMRRAVENAEDNPHQAWEDLMSHHIDKKDFVLGIAASGTTPYVIGGLQKCQQMGISTGAICCNAHSPVAQYADFPIEAVVGPEFVTGSTRMKAGTAQKLILNMISTTVMIQLGRVRGNRMVDMKLSNQKLIDRGTQMVMLETPWDYPTARAALLEKGSVRLAIDKWKNKE